MRLRFLQSAFAENSWPAPVLPEVALYGRSNGGKSSLVNALAHAKVARVSHDPGRTRTLNFYAGEGVLMVDMPGYGYAHMSKAAALRQAELLGHYLGRREALAGVVQIVDIRHAPSPLDALWHRRLQERGLPLLLLLGKADAVSRGHWPARRRAILEALGSGAQTAFWSARSGEGLAALEAFLQEVRGQVRR